MTAAQAPDPTTTGTLGTVSRRWVVRAGALAAAGTVGAALTTVGTEPTLAATVEGERVSATTHDGRIADVTITPVVTMAWDGAETAAETCRLRLTAENGGSTATLCERTGEEIPESAEGSMTCDDLGTHSLIQEGPYEPADFAALEDGTTTETTVPLTLDCGIADRDGDPIATTTTHPAIVVRVTNEAVTVTVETELHPAVHETETG